MPDELLLTFTYTSALVNRFDVLSIAVDARNEPVVRLVIVTVID